MGNSKSGVYRVCSSGQTIEASRENIERLIKSIINDKDWQRINALLIENPIWASYQDDEHGLLPIHRSLLCGAPKETIEILLRQFPEGVSTAEVKRGRIPLHIAAMCVSGADISYEIIKLLMELYSDGIFTKDAEGKLPIHHALLYRASYKIISLLIDAYPKGVEVLMKDGKSPLFLACEGRVSNDAVLHILQRHPLAVKLPAGGKLPLHVLLEVGAFTESAIRAILKVDPEGAGRKTMDGMLCIHYALARRADLAVVRLLAQAYPDGIDIKCKKGRLPIHYAIDRRCSEDVIFFLLETSKNSASRKEYNGDLPLHVALERRSSYQVVHSLLQAYPRGASEKDRYETLPLRRAVKAKVDFSIIDLLLRANSQAAAEADDYGRLPLHYAVSGLLPLETISALVRNYPPCVSMADIHGVLPIHLAVVRRASMELLEMLVSSYPEGLLVRDNNGYLPLHFALIMDAPTEITLFLLEKNPATAAEWLNTQTPLHIALATRRPEPVIRRLLDANPQAAREQEGGGGRLPLMVAMERGATLSILLLLEDAFAEDCAVVPDYQGRLPIHYALKYNAPQELFRKLLYAYPSVIGETDFSFYYDGHAFGTSGDSSGIMQRPMSPFRPDLGGDAYSEDAFVDMNNPRPNTNTNTTIRSIQSPGEHPFRPVTPTTPIISSRPSSPFPLRFERDNHGHEYYSNDHGGRSATHKLILDAEEEEGEVSMTGNPPANYNYNSNQRPRTALKPPRTPTSDMPPIRDGIGTGTSARGRGSSRPVSAYNRAQSPLLTQTQTHGPSSSTKRRSITFIDNNSIRRDSLPSATHGSSGRRRSSLSRKSKESANKLSPLQLGAMAIHFVSRTSPSVVDKLTGRSRDGDGHMPLGSGRPMSPGSGRPDSPHSALLSTRSRPATAREAAENAAMRSQFREKRLLQFAVEDMQASQEAVAEILKLSMPISVQDCSQNPQHYYNWIYVLAETDDRYVDAVDMVLDTYGNNPLAMRLLNDSPDRLGRRAIEVATRKCQQALSRRLYFYGRYELAPGPFAHESPDSVVWFATDYDRIDNAANAEASQRVVLKFMRSRTLFYHAVRALANVLTSDKFVVRIVRYHDGDEDPHFLQDTSSRGLAEFRYCIVLAAGDRDLAVSLLRDRYTIKRRSIEGLYVPDWIKIGKVGRDITAALAHIHSHGIVHGNLAPSNIILQKGVFKLNDFSASASYYHDDEVGCSPSSLAYMPPEMINFKRLNQSRIALSEYLEAAAHSPAHSPAHSAVNSASSVAQNSHLIGSGGNGTEPVPADSSGGDLACGLAAMDEGEGDKFDLRLCALTALKADPSLDMWSLGAIVFHLCRGEGLLRPLQGDILDDEQLKQLACWSDWDTANKLSSIDNPVARNFLSQLLQVQPRRRTDAVDIIHHPFVCERSTAARFPGIAPVYDVYVCYRSPPYTESSVATLQAGSVSVAGTITADDHRSTAGGLGSDAGDDDRSLSSMSVRDENSSVPGVVRIPLTANALAERSPRTPVAAAAAAALSNCLQPAVDGPHLTGDYGVILGQCLTEDLGLRISCTPMELTKNVWFQEGSEELIGEGVGIHVIREGDERDEDGVEGEGEDGDEDDDKSLEHNIHEGTHLTDGNNNQDPEDGFAVKQHEPYGFNSVFFNNLFEAARKMIQSRTAVFVLSRGTINEGVNSFEELSEDSPVDPVLLQMRLAIELRALGLLEGGIVSVVVGDPIFSDIPTSKPMNDGAGYDAKELDVSYGEYFGSYDGESVGHYGGCHPRCSSTVVVHPVEDSVAELLRRHHLGKKVYDSLSVLEIVSAVVAQSVSVVGPIATAWTAATREISGVLVTGLSHADHHSRSHAATHLSGSQQSKYVSTNTSPERMGIHAAAEAGAVGVSSGSSGYGKGKERLLRELEAKEEALKLMQEEIERLREKLED